MRTPPGPGASAPPADEREEVYVGVAKFSGIDGAERGFAQTDPRAGAAGVEDEIGVLA